jgi:D-tyrosyl-tRNA(Tyr) deacylase
MVDEEVIGQIGSGLLVLLGVAKGDGPTDVDYVAEKLAALRVFSDETGKMNRSVADVGGALLVVSQFTLLGDTRQGRRPGFDAAAPPDLALTLYERLIQALRAKGLRVETGRFGAHMRVALENDGPVTFIVESPERASKLLSG